MDDVQEGTSDAEIAWEALAGGALREAKGRAWELFDRAWPVLESRLALYLGSLRVPRDLRDDCGQQSLLRVWRARDTYKGSGSEALGAWVYRITQREFLRLVSSRSRSPQPESALSITEGIESLVPGHTDSPELAVESVDELTALESCVQRLEADQRAVIEFFYSSEGGTERKVADVLGIPKSSVHVIRRRALERLAACMRAAGGGS